MKPEMIMPAKVNVRALAAVSKFVSTEETRYYLNGVLVEIEPRAVTYIATDGHRLMVYRDERMDDGTPDNDMTGAFIIPTAMCRHFKAKKDDSGEADLYGDRAELTLKRGVVGLVFAPIDGTFPDWRRVLPKLPLAQGIGQYRGDYLATFQKVSEELVLGSPFVAHNGEGPALVRFPADPDALGFVMPFKAQDDRMTPLPLWVETPFAQAAE